jgi:hypothetical protein
MKLPSPQLWYFDQTRGFTATKVVLRHRPEMVLAKPQTVQKAQGATKHQVGVHPSPPHVEEALHPLADESALELSEVGHHAEHELALCGRRCLLRTSYFAE